MPPSTPAPAPTCDHCGYDLTGIAPDDVAQPNMARCPECGKRTDIVAVRAPTMRWWKFPLAVFTGTVTTLFAIVLLYKFMMGLPGSGLWSEGRMSLPGLTGVALGGAASMAVVWRERIANLYAERPTRQVSLRTAWFLLIDFVMYCIVNSILLLAVVWLVTEYR